MLCTSMMYSRQTIIVTWSEDLVAFIAKSLKMAALHLQAPLSLTLDHAE